jgi:hypothetical protein
MLIISGLYFKGSFDAFALDCKGKGNSSRQQRAGLTDRFISLSGENSISYPVAEEGLPVLNG